MRCRVHGSAVTEVRINIIRKADIYMGRLPEKPWLWKKG